MKDRTIIIAAVIVGLSIVYLAGSFRKLTGELSAFREENPDFVGRLERLTEDIPQIADEAGEQAAQGAVRGVIAEVVEKPMARLQNSVRTAAGGEGLTLPDGPLVRFEVVKPEISIEVIADLKALPFLRALEEAATTNGVSSSE